MGKQKGPNKGSLWCKDGLGPVKSLSWPCCPLLVVGTQADRLNFSASGFSGNNEVNSWLWGLFTDLREAHNKSSIGYIPDGPASVNAVSPR